MKDDGKETTHPSYALAVFSRTQGGGRAVFGSELLHHDTIRLRVSRAKHIEDLAHEWYFPTQEILELEFSPHQFATLLTTLNVGSGVPCTLTRLEGQSFKYEPPTDLRTRYQADLDDAGKDAVRSLIELQELIDTLPLSGVKKKELLGKVSAVRNKVSGTMPFIVNQFHEKMETVVADGKAALEAFTMGMVVKTGLEALQAQAPTLPPALSSSLPEEPCNDCDCGTSEACVGVEAGRLHSIQCAAYTSPALLSRGHQPGPCDCGASESGTRPGFDPLDGKRIEQVHER
jgi:hypothetical protein